MSSNFSFVSVFGRIISPALAFVLGLLSPPLQAMSLQCAAKDNWIDRTVCLSPSLTRLDKAMNKRLEAVKKNNFLAVQTQRDWLRYRRDRCETISCIDDVYRTRITQLATGKWQEIGLTLPPAGSRTTSERFIYAASTKRDTSIAAPWLRESHVLEQTFALIRPHYRFRKDLRIYAMDCDEANAYYYDSKAAIVVCYELIARLINRSYDLSRTRTDIPGERQLQILRNSVGYVLLHELGHVVNQPRDISRRLDSDESDADAFASVLLIDLQRTTEERSNVLFAVGAFAAINRNGADDAHAYSAEHGHPGQRFEDLLCLAIGADSSLLASAVSAGNIAKEKALTCGAEWRTQRAAVTRLPHPVFP